ncbi:MAG: CPBP family intramembrane metalloprotease [Clostridia bacterium]|nr:CPBP family intramembrane metalloprotease [Clostridia bacterium]
MREFPARPAMAQAAAQQSRAHHPVLECLIFCALFTVCSMVQTAFLLVPTIAVIFNSGVIDAVLAGEVFDSSAIMGMLPPWYTLLNLLATGAVVAGAILYCRFLEKRKLWTMGLVRRGFGGEYAVGWFIGAGMVSLSMLPGLLAGDIRITGLSADIPWGMLILMLIGFTIQGLSEELLCRSYFCISLARRTKMQWAVVISSVAFALLHGANGGLTLLAMLNLFLYGAFAALWLIRRGNIWGIAAMHSAWNYVQGNVWGSTVSGLDVGGSLFTMEHIGTRTIWAGGQFGLEGGLGVTAVLAIGTIVLCLMKNRSPVSAEQNDLSK